MRSQQGEITVIDNRLGIWKPTDHADLQWFHICHPRKLYREVKDVERRDMDGSVFAANWNTRSNSVKSMLWYVCRGCNHELNKREQILVKLGLLGVRR